MTCERSDAQGVVLAVPAGVFRNLSSGFFPPEKRKRSSVVVLHTQRNECDDCKVKNRLRTRAVQDRNSAWITF